MMNDPTIENATIKSECTSEYIVDVAASHPTTLRVVLTLIEGISGSRAVSWREIDGKLVFYRSYDPDHDRAVRLPCDTLGGDMLTPLVVAWLAKRGYPPKPEHDGSNTKGWRVRSFGYDAMFSVEPYWLEHHK